MTYQENSNRKVFNIDLDIGMVTNKIIVDKLT